MKLLLLSSSPFVDGGLAKSVADQHSVDLGSVHIISNSGSLVQTQLTQTYTMAISISDSAEFHTAEYLSSLAKILEPGATLQIQQPSPSGGQTIEKMKHALVLGGFVDVQPVGSVPGLVILRASVPKWGIGTKSALPLKSKLKAATTNGSTTTGSAAAAPAASAWSINPDDDEELVDADELLTQEDLKRPAPAAKKADDCEVGAGRKACKDCTCGRAEAEAKGQKVVLTQEMIDNPQSSCGNCSLGDAFRCASCPYKGLPAFEAGKKIQLPSSFLAVDV